MNGVATPSRHVVILGAGALGTLFGARLSRVPGIRVTLIGRDPHVSLVRSRGVTIRSGAAATTVRTSSLGAVRDASQVAGDVDCLVIAVKRRDTQAALADATRIAGRVACVVSLQNGVDQDARLEDVFGPDVVIGGVTMEGAALPAPAVVEHLLASRTYLGARRDPRSDRVRALAAWLRQAGFDVEVAGDIECARWTKFVQSCAASGVCGLTRLGLAPALATEPGARLYVELVREGVAVMRTRHGEPGDYLGWTAPIHEIATLSIPDSVMLVRRLAAEMLARGYVGATSLARDLAEGRPTEVEDLLGAMRVQAGLTGLATPAIDVAYWAISSVDERVVTTATSPGSA